ncbi:MAG TPA: hypothetical protein VF011_03590 [Terriglobales bacterium]
MPEKRFVRRRKSIPEQSSPVSTREQARLLNDPSVPLDHAQGASASEHTSENQLRTSRLQVDRTAENFYADDEAA